MAAVGARGLRVVLRGCGSATSGALPGEVDRRRLVLVVLLALLPALLGTGCAGLVGVTGGTNVDDEADNIGAGVVAAAVAAVGVAAAPVTAALAAGVVVDA